MTNDLKIVDDIASRLKIDTTSIRNKLASIEKQSEVEKHSTMVKLRENLGLLADDMALQLRKIAHKLNPNKSHNESEQLLVKSRVQRSRSRSSSDSADEDNSNNESKRKFKKLKKRRKLHKTQAERSDSTDFSSNSEDASNKSARRKDEPFIIAQDIDEVLNGNANSNSANESLRKENDFLGFDDEIDIKQEATLNDSILSNPQSSLIETQNSTETSNIRLNEDLKDGHMSVDEDVDEKKEIISKGDGKQDLQKNVNQQSKSTIKRDADLDQSSTSNLSEDDEEDEHIRRYV